MALELTHSISATPDKVTINIVDTTGLYDLATNPTGWGTPNTARNAVALVLYATFQPYNLDLINLSFDPSDTETVIEYSGSFANDYSSTFSIDYYKDGWYTFHMIAIPTSNGSPEENDIIYNTGTSELQIYKTGAFTDLESTDWEYLVDDEKYTLVTTEKLYLLNLTSEYSCQMEKYIECIMCTTCKCENINEELVKLQLLIQGAEYRFATQKQFEAQRMTEILTKQFKCCS